MNPSGVQLIIPMVPPGRHTRTSSSAVAWCRGANIAPTQDSTTSNPSAGKGSASTSASTHSSSTPAAAACLRPTSNSSGVRSEAIDARTQPARGDGGVAGAGADVEHPLAGRDRARRRELRPERRDQLGGHGRVVAGRPHGAVAGLELPVGRDLVDRAGHRPPAWMCSMTFAKSRVARSRRTRCPPTPPARAPAPSRRPGPRGTPGRRPRCACAAAHSAGSPSAGRGTDRPAARPAPVPGRPRPPG